MKERAKYVNPQQTHLNFTPDCTDEMLPACEEFH